MTAQRTAQQNDVSGHVLGKMSDLTRVYVREDFTNLPRRSSANLAESSKSQIPLTNPNFVLAGGGGAAPVMDSNGGWVYKVSSSASSKSLGYWVPRTGSKLKTLTFGTGEEPAIQVRMKTPSSIASTVFGIGFVTTRVPDLVTDSYQAKFWFDTDQHATKVYAATSTNTTGTVVDTLTDLETDLAASTLYTFGVTIDDGHQAHFYINGEEKFVSAAIDNDGAAVDLVPYVAYGPANKVAAVTPIFYHATVSKNDS